MAGTLDADEAGGDVAPHLFGRTREGVTVAAAAGYGDDPLPVLDPYLCTGGQRLASPVGMDEELVQLIVDRMTHLNREIREDPLLGENYEIGHSFFLPKGDNFAGLDRNWYVRVVRTEIIPLLKEYWFDNPKRAEDAEKMLLA